MLKSVPVQYCIIGHSERRDYFHETDEDQNKKAAALIAGGIVPIFCCGEPLEVRESGTYVEHVVAQVKAGLTGLEVTDPSQLVVAYEPIWAIGTGKTATADDAQEVCGAVREALAEIFGAELAEASAFCTAAPPSPAISPSSWPSPMWTAPSWVARPSWPRTLLRWS